MRKHFAISILKNVAGFILAMTGVCAAQDRRTVVEPTVPPVCLELKAVLSLHHGKLTASDEANLDTARLQHALDACGQGKAVELQPDGSKGAFLIGPVNIPAGVTLLVDAGATVVASRDPRLYDMTPGSCGLVNNQPEGCKAVISVNHAPHAAIMGEGVIDGRGGERLLNATTTWWELAEKARSGGRQQVPRLIVADGSDDFTLYRLTLRNSANFHVVYRHGRGFTVWGLKIDTPRTARNTDGLDPGPAEDVTVTHSLIRTGDDNIAIKGSDGGVAFMSVVDNHFYDGHGMSIGSETVGGVHDILVRNLSLDGPDNGIRIKSNPSRGGLVERVEYNDVCIRNSKRPIVLDTHYENAGANMDLYPQFRNIRLENVRVSGGGAVGVEGLDAQHRISLTLDGVTLDDLSRYTLRAAHADVRYGPGPVNFSLSGDDVTTSGQPGKGAGVDCSGKFVPFDDSTSKHAEHP